jgi:hypothetical protein
VPTIALFILFSIYISPWHIGVLFYLWFFVLWISFDTNDIKQEIRFENVKKLKKTVVIIIIIVLSVQIYWSVRTAYYDFNNNYSSSLSAAEYIKTNHLENKRIYISAYYSIAILPYFDSNIFKNYNNGHKPAFLCWSTKNNIFHTDINSIIKENPDYILLNARTVKNMVKIPGYKAVAGFDGSIYWKDNKFGSIASIFYKKE